MIIALASPGVAKSLDDGFDHVGFRLAADEPYD